ncbi:Flp family type IVb pilin [Sinomonas mesophila]|uniref:Flp family type IVb pilin n=1 Tax=Sinomonas mesophila TaxID=1531955 RepID=UPI0009875382|nr:Flp family type IVb pilin [Sinomonas mesophila]
MDKFLVSLQMFWNDITGKGEKEKGATMVEYGIMVALIAVVVMLAVGPLGTAIAGMFTSVGTTIGTL